MAKVAIPQESKMFKVNSWSTVTMWVYRDFGEICSICKNPLNEACITCQSNQESNEAKDCRKVVGICNHCFHTHCIDSWIKKQNKCPLCFKEWQQMKFLD